MLRLTDDSTTDLLQNKTVWSGLYRNHRCETVLPEHRRYRVKVDAEQFGSQQVTRNYLLRGRIVPVPSNYDPLKRTYTGLWDGTFKPARTDNPARCVLDMLTHPRYGMEAALLLPMSISGRCMPLHSTAISLFLTVLAGQSRVSPAMRI